eukprot:scaffold20447_cov88-Skeletonema_marinoi.AAC.4
MSLNSLRVAGLVANAGKSHCKFIQNARHLSSSGPAAPARPVRQAVTKEERAARRAARKEQASAVISNKGAVSGEAAKSAGPSFDASRMGWYAAVIIPTALIGWGIVDDDSPLAQLSRMVGLTDAIEEYAVPSR